MSRKKIRLAVIGPKGRMGTRILALAHQDPRFEQIVGVDRSDRLDSVLPDVDVVIDFTSPEATLGIAQSAVKAKCALVIGTTGLKEAALSKLRALSNKTPVVFSPNMSVGMNVLFQLVEDAAKALANYDIKVIEAHHTLKKDAPSGSAIKLANAAAEGSARKDIDIASVRAGDIVGDHTVLIAGPGERLELTHRAHSRDAFASGALAAAAWAVGRKPGFYSMKDVLSL